MTVENAQCFGKCNYQIISAHEIVNVAFFMLLSNPIILNHNYRDE